MKQLLLVGDAPVRREHRAAACEGAMKRLPAGGAPMHGKRQTPPAQTR